LANPLIISGFCLNGQALSGFLIWLTGNTLRSVGDFFAGTAILHDPDRVLGLSRHAATPGGSSSYDAHASIINVIVDRCVLYHGHSDPR
jgi:hypothetical protein